MYQLFTLVVTRLTEIEDQRHSTQPGKGQNSESEVGFLLNVYLFCTHVKSKSLKSNTHKTRTICVKVLNKLF